MLSYDFYFVRNTCAHVCGYDMANCNTPLNISVALMLKYYYLLGNVKRLREAPRKMPNPLSKDIQGLFKIAIGSMVISWWWPCSIYQRNTMFRQELTSLVLKTNKNSLFLSVRLLRSRWATLGCGRQWTPAHSIEHENKTRSTHYAPDHTHGLNNAHSDGARQLRPYKLLTFLWRHKANCKHHNCKNLASRPTSTHYDLVYWQYVKINYSSLKALALALLS